MILCWLCRDAIVAYFPVADEWSILAHSLPGLANPMQWLTSGFAGYVDSYPGHPIPTNFLRPFFNLAYWLCGRVFGPFFGGYLFVNYLAIGGCAMLLYLCLRQDERCSPRLALALALLFPLVPSLACEPGSLTLLQSMMAYDAVTCLLSLAAYLAYDKGRIAATAVLLTIALFTKESALPVAIGLPLAHVWSHRRDLHGARVPLLTLASPIGLWLVLRTLAFGNPLSGTYVLAGPEGTLWTLAKGLVRMPLYAPSPHIVLQSPWSGEAALFWLNAATAIAVAILLVRRWARTREFRPAELALLLAVPFFALVGRASPRFGATMHAFLFLTAGRSGGAHGERVARGALIALLAVNGALQGLLLVSRLPNSEMHALEVFSASREYAKELERLGERPVIVLNDPTTPFSSPKMMAIALRLPMADRWKASDFPQFYFGYRPPCSNSVQQGRNTVELQQSCGVLAWGIKPRASLQLAPDIQVHFPEVSGDSESAGWGHVLRLETSRPGIAVLWYDPERRAMRMIETP